MNGAKGETKMAKKSRPRGKRERTLNLGDKVMLGDVSFRVKDIDGDIAHVKQSHGKRVESVLIESLAFEDKIHLWRLQKPHCTKCRNLMVHFVDGRTDTWICPNPDCPLFDYQLAKFCPACGTARIKRAETGMFICLNPNCATYKGDILGNEEVAGLEDTVRAQREAAQTALEDATKARAKPGQGTAAAARRRREARAKLKEQAAESDDDRAIDEAFGDFVSKKLPKGTKATAEGVGRALRNFSGAHQSLITLPEVDRQPETSTYESYRHVATQLVFRRKIVDGDADDPIKVLSEEEAQAVVAQKLKGSKWRPKTAESVAVEIVKVIRDGAKVEGVEYETEDVVHIVWRCSHFIVKVKEESWQGDKGRKQKLQVKFSFQGETGKAKHEEARGELRAFIQDRMKKTKGQLVDGPLFEGAYVSLYRQFIKEVNPDDDDDPGASATGEEWLRAALPDTPAQT